MHLKSEQSITLQIEGEKTMSGSCKTTTAGWREWVELPDIGVPRMVAKIDTGTEASILYTSFIEHCRRDNNLWVRFCVNFLAEDEQARVVCQAPVKRVETIQSSENHNESVFVIEATINIGNLQTQQDIVLKNQNGKKYIMHLGRSALQDLNILIDPNSSYVLNNQGEQTLNPVSVSV